jgi:RNA methyltransferase, TrmH family
VTKADISSRQSSRFKWWLRALDKGPQKTGATLVSGRRICLEVAALPDVDLRCWIVPEGWEGDLPDMPEQRWVLSRPLFRELDEMGVGFPLLEVGLEGRIVPHEAPLTAGLYLALPTQDPLNTGAAIRTAAGLGASAVILLPGAASPFHPRAVRASAGSVFRIPLYSSAWSLLVEQPATVYLLDTGGTSLEQVAWADTSILVVGMEGPGTEPLVQGEQGSFQRVSLPMQNIESYNVTVAAAMAMYHWRRQR